MPTTKKTTVPAPAADPAPPRQRTPTPDRSPLREALLTPGAGETTRAVLIALAGLGPAGELDITAAAANLDLHPSRIRSWLRRAHDDHTAGAVLLEVMAHLYPQVPPNAGAVDVDAAAHALTVHVSTVRRWVREPVRAAAATEALHRILTATGPQPVAIDVGTVNVSAAAEALGVSSATIRRWLRTGSAALPTTRVDQLLQLTEPTPQVLLREHLNLQHAQDCIHRLRLGRGRGGMSEQYGQTGWLEPHVVSILEIPGTGLRRVAVTRVNTRPLQRLRSAAVVVDFSLPLPHKFAATLVRHDVLDAAAGWRIEASAGALDSLAKGRTQAWIAAASLPSLDELVRQRS